MKKIVSILLVLVMALGLFACGENNTNDPTAKPSDANAFSSDDLYIMVNDVKLVAGGNQTDFLKLLSDAGITETGRDEASSCMFGSTGGKDITIYFDFGSVFTFPQAADVDNTVDEIYVMTNNCKLRGGITIGATKQEIIDVFGEGYFEIGGTMIYNVEGDAEKSDSLPKISFYFEEGVVSAIDLCANLYHING